MSNKKDYQQYITTITKNYPPSNYSMLREALDESIVLMKKATPFKPTNQEDSIQHEWLTEGQCKCGNTVVKNNDDDYYTEDYCRQCGQALDWSDDDTSKI